MTTLLSNLSPALDLFEQQLQLFVESSDFYTNMALAFGESHDYSAFEPILMGGRTSVLELVEILPSATLNGAYGAFSRDTNKIYLASEFINLASPSALASVILEEYGHYIDAQLNPVETIGDEGEIFADLVLGKAINPSAFTENDTATITLNGETIIVEQGSPIIYVRQGATGANNGTSWANAYTDLQTALASAPAGSEIWVSAGAYKPTTTNDRTISFNLKQGVEIYGGFNGSETQRDQRNWNTNQTILSGDIRSIGVDGDNSYHVVSASDSITNTSRLDGFRITNGNNDQFRGNGGGIYNNGSDAIFANLSIVSNQVSDVGGGMYTLAGNPQLLNVSFNDNSAASQGGAIYSGSFRDQGGITLNGVTFLNNTSTNQGGAIYNYFSNLGLTNVIFINNQSTNLDGGAIINDQGNIGITNAQFISNQAFDDGGAIYTSSGETSVINGVFINNQANDVDSDGGYGGAIVNVGSSETSFINVIFDNNITELGGGAIANFDSSQTTLTNTTLSRNFANNGNGGGIYSEDTSEVTVNNSILWGNRSTISSNEIYITGNATTQVNYSIVQGGYAGTNNQNVDPLFVNQSAGDLNIQANSPAINRGNNLSFPLEITSDVAGNPRISNGTIDIGAYEFFPFDPAQYGASHPDLIRVFGYNLEVLRQHYFNTGRFEGRATDNFNEFRYIASNRDLIAAFGANGAVATEHYIRNGFNEGRSLTAFDPDQYLASHRDLLTAFGYDPARATFHYILAGVNEGRSTDSFNEFRYIASHNDLIRAFGYNAQAGTNHYLFNGLGEGRNPLIFNPSSYLASNGDLIRFVNQNFASPVDGSFGSNYGAVLEFATFHFIVNGFGEGRSRGTFNPAAYLNRHADLRNAFGNDSETALRHYIEFGFEENRAMM